MILNVLTHCLRLLQEMAGPLMPTQNHCASDHPMKLSPYSFYIGPHQFLLWGFIILPAHFYELYEHICFSVYFYNVNGSYFKYRK